MRVFNSIAVFLLTLTMGYTVFTGGGVEDIILAAVMIIMIWVGEIADDVTQILKLKKKEVTDE